MTSTATLPPPRAETAADPDRRRATAAGLVLLGLLAVNLPAFLRTALDCDPITFDLYVRDAQRGRVLYRDMLENNTPAMIWLHAGVRAAFGWSSEALRAVDLLVVGGGVWLLAGWFNRDRLDRQLLAAAVFGSVYLTASEWCHCQRDVWLLLPVVGAMRMRRAALAHDSSRVPGAILEGMTWAVAVWLKPHMLLVALSVWLAGVAVARRVAGRELLGLVAGGLLVGGLGVAAMLAAGVWGPYWHHLTTWAGEYPRADMYGPFGRLYVLLGCGYRLFPWSVLYLVALPAAVAGLWPAGRPERPLLAAALLAWAGQAFLLQHAFDYVHLPAILLAVALLLDVSAGRTLPTFVLLLVAVCAHAPVYADRLSVWQDCFAEPTPALRDRLARFDRIGWQHLAAVAEFLKSQDVHDGELSVLGDTAIPLYQLTGLTPPTRYYVTRNNMLAYKSRRAEIQAALAAVPGQRFAVVDLAGLGWKPPTGHTWADRDAWPLPAVLGTWADRAAFRSGRYVVLAIPAADVPALLAAVSEF